MALLIPIGEAFFDRKHYSTYPLNRLLSMRRKEVINKQNWRICEENFEQNWHLIFGKMAQTRVKEVEMDNNRFPYILHSIIGVNFTRMIHLNLQHNKIVSIELIGAINAPYLEKLNLGNNLITSVRPLRKAYINKLEYLCICNNKIQDLNCLTQLNCPLTKIVLEWMDNQMQGGSLRWLIKFPTKQPFNYIRVQSQRRKSEPKYQSVLDRKFNKDDWLWLFPQHLRHDNYLHKQNQF